MATRWRVKWIEKFVMLNRVSPKSHCKQINRFLGLGLLLNSKEGTHIVKKQIVLTAFALIVFAAPASARNCGVDFQHAYEKGVNNGRADGARMRDYHPRRHHSKVSRGRGQRGRCYIEGYGIGYDNAFADAKKKNRKHPHDGAPTPGSNERAYYDDGCHEGTVDAQASMSMAYERHADMYDSRFKPFFAKGYKKCWKHYR
jgi:hypothetical protein